jgi:hypothetical protein
VKTEQLEKAIKLNNEIRNLQRKLGVVQGALDKDNWDENYIEIVIGDDVEGTVYGKDVFDFLYGYLKLKLTAAKAEFENL